MSSHGPISLWTALDRIQSRAIDEIAEPKPDSVPLIPGFRHFLNDPEARQRFAIDGVPFNPKDLDQRARAESLMEKLAAVMRAETPPSQPPPRGFNTDIPSGYTYFLQLIAHDLVESSLFLSRNQSSAIGLSNVRSKPLQLETIFGGGPIQCPYAYEASASGFRDRLRLGGIRREGQRYDGQRDDLRDVARARATELLTQDSYPEALIADARNDSHAILSQIVVMFHHLQNKILESLEANERLRLRERQFVDPQRKFVATQAACALIYRNIIRHDILAKILHPKVRAGYESGAVQVVDQPGEFDRGRWSAPLEFCFGFFRFGHAMIRGKYSFNPRRLIRDLQGFDLTFILQHTSEKGANLMPFEDVWTIDWEQFFGSDPATTNFSVRIGPWSRPDLETAVQENDPSEPGLAMRDLTSSIATQPWSVRALAEKLSNTHGELLRLSPYLAGALDDAKNPPWFTDLSRWLSDRRSPLGLSLDDNDIRTLATDPPIPFFARFEAGVDPEIFGKHLGVLTSIVVADVFYGIFQHDRILGVDGNQDLAGQLQQASKVVFNEAPDAFSGLEGITTVRNLIDFLGPRIKFPAGG
jgi:hypothetical protein